MKLIINSLFIGVLFVGVASLASAQASVKTESTTGIVTMFALDPLTQSVCFRDGGPGAVFQTGQTKNRCSDLNFNSYSANSFTVGIEGGKDGVIIDLGTAEQLKAKYRFQETIGKGQGFASIDVKNGKALILKDYKTGELQQLGESAQLFVSPSDKVASAPVKLGHIYLLRVTDPRDKGFEMFAKVLVVAHVPNESVTVRWVLLANNETAKL